MKVLGFVQWVNPIPQQPFVLRYSQTSVLKFVQHSSGLLRVAGHIWKTSPPTIRVGLLPGHDASASLRPDASHYRN